MANLSKFILSAGVALVIAAPALAQSDRVNENVNLSPDATHPLYSGAVNMSAQPCPAMNWNMNLPVTGVKSNSEAHKQVKEQIDAFADDVKKISANCPPPPH